MLWSRSSHGPDESSGRTSSKLLACFSAALLFAASNAANALVIDFDSLETTSGKAFVANSYVEDGFTISGQPLVSFGQANPFYAGSAGMFVAGVYGKALLTASVAGTPFSLNSIDLSLYAPGAKPHVVTFIGQLVGGGTVSQSFNPVGFGFKTFDFSSAFTDLTSLSWMQGTTAQSAHQFDNIDIVAKVPEPGTLALLFAGLIALVVGRLKKSK